MKMHHNLRPAYAAIMGCALATMPAPAFADVKAGVEDWAAGNYEAAVKVWRPLADAGDPDAQFNLAQAYKMGRGVPVDLDKAEALYGKAAAQGHVQASDIYGLLLFQRGDRARALPYIEASARRGDPRAWYILGIAHFNGDLMAKDWVRAYALVSLAQQAGLPQAARALAQMDQHIPLAQRQESVPLAAKIAAAAKSTRAQQLASADLGTKTLGTPPKNSGAPDRKIGDTVAAEATGVTSQSAAIKAKHVARTDSPATAGADFARPPAPATAKGAVTSTQPAKIAPLKAVAVSAETHADRLATKPAIGPWRVQLGAFGVAANVDALWSRVSRRPELAGHHKLAIPAGRLIKLQAAGFATEADANAACSHLKAAGFSCLPTRD